VSGPLRTASRGPLKWRFQTRSGIPYRIRNVGTASTFMRPVIEGSGLGPGAVSTKGSCVTQARDDAACAISFLAYRAGTEPDARSCGRTLAEDLKWSKHAIAKALALVV
jgi:hypothetical protein